MSTKKKAVSKKTKPVNILDESSIRKLVREEIAKALIEFAENTGGAYGTQPVVSAAVETAHRLKRGS